MNGGKSEIVVLKCIISLPSLTTMSSITNCVITMWLAGTFILIRMKLRDMVRRINYAMRDECEDQMLPPQNGCCCSWYCGRRLGYLFCCCLLLPPAFLEYPGEVSTPR